MRIDLLFSFNEVLNWLKIKWRLHGGCFKGIRKDTSFQQSVDYLHDGRRQTTVDILKKFARDLVKNTGGGVCLNDNLAESSLFVFLKLRVGGLFWGVPGLLLVAAMTVLIKFTVSKKLANCLHFRAEVWLIGSSGFNSLSVVENITLELWDKATDCVVAIWIRCCYTLRVWVSNLGVIPKMVTVQNRHRSSPVPSLLITLMEMNMTLWM